MSPLVAAARSLLGTPYHSHGRTPGLAIDCIGVPIVSAWISGHRPRTFDVGGYSMQPDGSMLDQCYRHMQHIARDEMRPGDVVVCRFQRQPHHVGIVGDYRHGGHSIIHADAYRHKRVIEHRLWLDGMMEFVAAFRILERAS